MYHIKRPITKFSIDSFLLAFVAYNYTLEAAGLDSASLLVAEEGTEV